MKNYQRRKAFIINDEVKEFKSYTKDGFYYKSTENLWFWKGRKNGKPFEFHAKSIEELKIIKKNNFIGKGNYEHKNDSSLDPEHTSTEEFGKKTGLGGKEYISMLLKRAVLPINENDNRGAGRKKKECTLLNVSRNLISTLSKLYIKEKFGYLKTQLKII